MKALVTTKGQVTIPKALREKFGIVPGAKVDFVAADDGIRLRKVVDRSRQENVLGCLKQELSGHTTAEWLDELRGRWSCHRLSVAAQRPDVSERNRRRYLRPAGNLQG